MNLSRKCGNKLILLLVILSLIRQLVYILFAKKHWKLGTIDLKKGNG